MFQQICCLRPSDRNSRALDADVGKLHIVHDDEAIEESNECRKALTIGLEKESVRLSKRGEVALNASLRVEHEVVAAFAGRKTCDGVGDHAVEPADAVFAGDSDPANVVQGGDADAVEQG